MILAIDVGNSNIVFGVIDNSEIILVERISTDYSKTELEYALNIHTIMDIHHIDNQSITGGIISSVVPEMTDLMRKAVNKIFSFTPLVVGPGIKTGINIRLDNPAEIGADIVADSVAAISEYKAPVIIVDMGTATTFAVIDENKNILGGLITPGVGVSLAALTSKASLLNGISIDKPKDIIGKNTKESMKSGIIYGNAAMIDGLIDRLSKKIGDNPTVVATGGLSKQIIPYCEHEIILDETLLLKGLNIIYQKNQ